jgi:hypothetical protein
VDTQLVDVAGVRVELPDRVGDWSGSELRFCQNAACQQAWTLADLQGSVTCPKCGGKLDVMAAAEKSLLPPDTIMLKKQYKNSAGRTLYASVVLSGKERASIHRPEVCLVGQGSEVTKRYVMPVDIAGRAPLDVMVLDLLHRRRSAAGQSSEFGSFYAYWFVGNGRETPHHWQRMLWMATDRIFRNVAHRWAYIAVYGGRDMENDIYEREAGNFIHELYPEMAIKPPSSG